MPWKRRKPSEILLRYIDGRGRGDEIDHYVHSNLSDEEEKVVSPLLEINRKFACGLTPGVSNPDAFADIRALAERLKSEGL